MAGLGRACPGHPHLGSQEDVDARHKAGHDAEIFAMMIECDRSF
jgi:hypothetical protein